MSHATLGSVHQSHQLNNIPLSETPMLKHVWELHLLAWGQCLTVSLLTPLEIAQRKGELYSQGNRSELNSWLESFHFTTFHFILAYIIVSSLWSIPMKIIFLCVSLLSWLATFWQLHIGSGSIGVCNFIVVKFPCEICLFCSGLFLICPLPSGHSTPGAASPVLNRANEMLPLLCK